MHRTVVREIAGPPGRRAPSACGWVVAAMLLGAGAALAAEPAPWVSETATLSAPLAPGAATGTPAAPASVIEISASNLPRFDNFDGSHRTQQRFDMALLSPGRSAFGVTMGVTGLSPSRYGFSGAAPDGTGAVNLGLQWRYMLENNRRIDITAWRDVGRPNDALALVQSRDTAYGARVEMQLSGPRSRFVADHGFIGMQLDGGGRITLRRSAGKPMVYYRNNF
ncbi:MAG: hypothetical protein JWQ33_2667 [Ramlibacter sp.]|nr:hypothetical protein [Ramlibacter sp.]